MRLYAKQIRENIIDFLKNNLDTKLQAIDAGFLIWPKNKIQTYSGYAISRMLPECVVLVSQGQNGEQSLNAIEFSQENYTVNIEISVKEADQEKLNLILDSYEQGIKELLHGADIGATFCYYQDFRRGALVDERNGAIFDGLIFTFLVRTN